jgi:hypothetical protein
MGRLQVEYAQLLMEAITPTTDPVEFIHKLKTKKI